MKYSNELFCDRQIFLQKLDAVLCYLEILQKNNKQMVISNERTPIRSNKIFIVHGHNEAIKESIARLIEKLGLEPIILHEKPNKGRTIIEKFVDYLDVNSAIVLLTADDVGKGKADTNLNRRARQNVIFELGYFLGKLGRSNVCALYEDGVEIPSDYDGVIFLKLDKADSWKFSVAKELKAVGFDVDMNKIV